MTNLPDTTLCTSANWSGRAYCSKCHIRHMMLFSELPETAFESLLNPVMQRCFPADTLIYDVMSDKKHIYSIRSGIVKLVNVSQDGSQRIVRLLGPGAAIGFELLQNSDNYRHTAFAVTDVNACKIPLSTLKQLKIKHPELGNHVRKQLQNQLDLADQWIVALGTGSTKQRVAQLILFMEKHFADDNKAFLLLSRDDMAAMTGIATETISRAVAEFKRQDILKKVKTHLYTCDTEQLEEIVQSGRNG